ncbi:short-subunit dehydrogenase [Litorivivens lipolytica]|uniref:Short-subunit dehydrogenase n=1 Tax=Litorivivens lipolytica TaxID=1524264 RepID=A0A7W4W674_9GAMM|nr:SDR family NAD(P)-dependent oxidoreductase [Litorivivens lipolytica]MBB3048202.1 short-subunit dehydrogenase [Litorivivens lipolytica]
MPDNFVQTYGPWALVLGASEGVGSAFVEALAARQLNVALVSRRQSVLDEVAQGIQTRFGVQTRTIAMDLFDHNAMEVLLGKIGDLEIGFLVNCAGGDAAYGPFLERELNNDEALLFRNCTLLMRVCHHFGRQMAERGRGGIVTMSSGAAVAGAPGLATYAGSKAFDLLFSEALWGELKPKGVDLICVMLADTDTPTLRAQMVMRGKLKSLDESPKGATPPEQVAEEALRYIGKQPTRIISRKLRVGSRLLGLMGRNRAVSVMTAAAKKIMGDQ